MTIRPYQDGDAAELLSLWEVALPCDAVTGEEFERRVLLDPNRDPESVLVAVEGAGAVITGFIICFVPRVVPPADPQRPLRACITMFAVHPSCRGRGVGIRLLERAVAWCREQGCASVAVAPYATGYFLPGVDRERHTDGLHFLLRHGFREVSEALAMDAPIGTYEISPEVLAREAELRGEGVAVRADARDHMTAFLAFMGDHMPWDWELEARERLRYATLGLFPSDGIQLAWHGERIVGYCQFVGEHFGPFGVVEDWQGRGVGTVLLARTLAAVRRHGHHTAYVLWTGERAAQGI